MKIYIAGPMRGYAEHNFPAFHEATATLRAAGHEVISPAEMDVEAYKTQEEIDKAALLPNATKLFMQRDLPALLTCDIVMMLPGWEKSTGALTEGIVAVMTGIEVMEYIGRVDGGPGVSKYRMLVALGEKITGVEK